MQPMPSPFRDAALCTDPILHSSAQEEKDRQAGGNSEGTGASVGVSGNAESRNSAFSRSGNLERALGRQEKSDQLAAALLRMSMRADEQLQEQARLVLQNTGT